jgi:hypothetical protein
LRHCNPDTNFDLDSRGTMAGSVASGSASMVRQNVTNRPAFVQVPCNGIC